MKKPTFIIAEYDELCDACDADVAKGEKHLTWECKDESEPVICLGCCSWISFTLLANTGESL